MFCSICGKLLPEESKFCSFCGTNIQNPTQNEGYGVSSTGLRFANHLIDYVLAIIILVIINVLGALILREGVNDVFSIIMALFFVPIYYMFFEGLWQRTPGKWITKTKVVRKDGSKPSFRYVIGRSFARLIPFEAFSFLANPVGWHDSLSGTLVVSSKYTTEEIKLINPKKIASSKVSTPIIIGICLFVGIIIIGLFSSVVLIALNGARIKSRDAKRISDVKFVSTSLEAYFNDYGYYPDSINDLTPEYLGSLPTPVVPTDGSCTVSQNEYKYFPSTLGDVYVYSFCLGEDTGGYQAGKHSLTPSGIQ